MPNSDARFELECFHNEYLPDGGRDVDAIITVTAPAARATFRWPVPPRPR